MDDLTTNTSAMSATDRRALLKRILRQRAEAESVFPLSHGQRALWFLHQLAPESAAYNIMGAARISGEVDIDALGRAFRGLVDRHACLRTTFTTRHGKPLQQVHEEVDFLLALEEASGWSDDDIESRLAREYHRPFDLAHGPLLRATLFTRSARERVLLLGMHHITADFWSLALLVNELQVLYAAEKAGAANPLALLPAQYRDYVRWQENELAGPRGEALWAYWEKELSGALPVLNLPTDRPRPSVQTYSGSTEPVSLSPALISGLKRIARSQLATLYMALLAVFQTLLYRYTGQEDLVIGSPTAGRSRSEFEGLIGYFVNPVALRVGLSAALSFNSLLSRVRRKALGALEHQDYPFPLLVERLQAQRDPSRSPIFQTMFVMEKAQLSNQKALAAFVLGDAGAKVDLNGLPMDFIDVKQRAAQFDLMLEIAEGINGGVTGFLQYNTDLFEAGTIARMIAHLKVLLAGIAQNPERALADLPLLTPAEEQQLLVEWNDTRADYPNNVCMHELFEEQVLRTPDSVAIVCDSATMTYAALNRRANRLARILVREGAGPEVLVALLADRGIDLLTAILAVFKAGGAYLPLDPLHPHERMGQIIRQSGSKLIVASRDYFTPLAQEPQAKESCRILILERLLQGQAVEQNLGARCLDRNLAYVIYTSGSTGIPKGAMVEHCGMLNHLMAKVTDLQLTAADRVIQNASQCFDISVWQFLAVLLVGGQVTVFNDEVTHDPGQFKEQSHQQAVSIMEVVPSFLRMLIAGSETGASGSDKPAALRWLISTGEALPPALAHEWLTRCPEVPLLNAYGPTECSDDVTHHVMKSPYSETAPSAPIGRPIGNVKAHIFDANLWLNLPGAPGELHIGGVCVGRGYLGRPDLTAERFVPNPVSGGLGDRLYKSGDLARHLADGTIEFMGRIDHQVKVRGFRIEPEEISAVLSAHPDIAECFVLAHEDEGGKKKLAAYVVAGRDRALSTAEMRAYLKGKLPDYMTPSSFIVLAALPLTSNGKIDRKALPNPEEQGSEAIEETAPRSDTEATLTRIWEDVLRLSQVGVHSNFFELGGDSILSIQVVARAHEAGLRFTPKDIFLYQTIAELGAAIEAAGASNQPQYTVEVSGPPTPIQSWFFEQNFPEPSLYNQVIMLELGKRLDSRLLSEAVHQVVSHHDVLRSRFHREPDGWRQVITDSEHHDIFSTFDLSDRSEGAHEVAIELLTSDLHRRLDLSVGPLIRVALFDLGPERPQRLLIIVHHLVVDSLSWRILLEDLYKAYDQLKNGERVGLGQKTTSFLTWSRLLAEYARSDEIRQEAEYWSARYDQSGLALLPDFTNGANVGASEAVITSSLDYEITSILLHEILPRHRARIDELLLAALGWAIGKRTGADSFLIDLERHGREDIFQGVSLFRTVGWFTTVFPVLVRIAPNNDNPKLALQAVKEELRGIPHGGIGFGLLRYLSEDEDTINLLKSVSAPEVCLNYLGELDRSLPTDSSLNLVKQASGLVRGGLNPRGYLLELDAYTIGGRLGFNFAYSKSLHHRSTIEQIAGTFIETLQWFAADQQSVEESAFALADFPLANLDHDTLKRLVTSGPHIEDIYPLSPVQQGMLFHSLYNPESGDYIEQMSCLLEGELDIPAFELAWQAIVRRTPALRTAFIWQDMDDPRQVVHRDAKVFIDRQDWRQLEPARQTELLESLLEEDRSAGFDFSTPPLMRFRLIRIDEISYHFVWSFHHLLLDGWCLNLILKELLAVYEAYRSGATPDLSESRPYRDYIEWLQKKDLSKAEVYWREKLKGIEASATFGVDRAILGAHSHRHGYAVQDVALSAAAFAALKSLARQHRFTISAILQGAWALLISRYSGNPDVVFGATVSGRPAEIRGIESIIGLFINVLPVRVYVLPEEPLIPWLKRLHEQSVQIQEYQYSPLIKVRDWAGRQSGEELFESLVVVENYPLDTGLLEQGTASMRIRNAQLLEHSNYPLSLVAFPWSDLVLRIIYDCDRFAADAIAVILTQYIALLQQMAENPQARLTDIKLIHSSENDYLANQFVDDLYSSADVACLQ